MSNFCFLVLIEFQQLHTCPVIGWIGGWMDQLRLQLTQPPIGVDNIPVRKTLALNTRNCLKITFKHNKQQGGRGSDSQWNFPQNQTAWIYFNGDELILIYLCFTFSPCFCSIRGPLFKYCLVDGIKENSRVCFGCRLLAAPGGIIPVTSNF